MITELVKQIPITFPAGVANPVAFAIPMNMISGFKMRIFDLNAAGPATETYIEDAAAVLSQNLVSYLEPDSNITNPTRGIGEVNPPFGTKGIPFNFSFTLLKQATADSSRVDGFTNISDVLLVNDYILAQNPTAFPSGSILSISSAANAVITFVGNPIVIDQNTYQTRLVKVGDILRVNGTISNNANADRINEYNTEYEVSSVTGNAVTTTKNTTNTAGYGTAFIGTSSSAYLVRNSCGINTSASLSRITTGTSSRGLYVLFNPNILNRLATKTYTLYDVKEV